MQRVAEDPAATGANAKDLSTQINYLNDLLEKGAINEAEYDQRAERLHRIGDAVTAITTGNNKELQSILKAHRNLDLNNVSERSATILHLAITSAIKGKAGADVIQTLMDERLDVDTVHNGFTPLLRVCDAAPFAAAADVAKALLKARADVNFAAKLANQKHWTPLSAAVARSHSGALVQALCEAGANVHVELEDGPVVFHAVVYEQVEVARVLLAHKANPNARDPDQGATALASAISSGNVELVKLLVAAGADKSSPVMKGKPQTAKDLVAQLLRNDSGNASYQEIQRLVG